LCDEPTGNLDSENSKEVIQLLLDTCKKFHAALVIVTHDPEIAGKMERVITISDGVIGGDIP
jgi:putative ABC transport system ATP-binding protein